MFEHTNSNWIGKILLQTTSKTPLFFKSILTMLSTLGGGGGDNDDSDGDNNDDDADCWSWSAGGGGFNNADELNEKLIILISRWRWV